MAPLLIKLTTYIHYMIECIKMHRSISVGSFFMCFKHTLMETNLIFKSKRRYVSKENN
jgi:hypothetical protein